MERHELTPVIEALLFAADHPLTVNAIVKALDDETDRAEVRSVLDGLQAAYDHQGRGFRLARLGNGYQLLSRQRFAPWIDNLIRTRRKMRLSRAALETVAVIAYKQPISRLEVERIRGVDAGGVLATLLERGLIMIKGRDPGPGRPLLYGTTQAFLEYFGLSGLGDLPRLDELASLAGIDRQAWDEAERARFEKQGVEDPEIPEVESLFSEEDEEEEIPGAGEGAGEGNPDADADAPSATAAAAPEDESPTDDAETVGESPRRES